MPNISRRKSADSDLRAGRLWRNILASVNKIEGQKRRNLILTVKVGFKAYQSQETESDTLFQDGDALQQEMCMHFGGFFCFFFKRISGHYPI